MNPTYNYQAAKDYAKMGKVHICHAEELGTPIPTCSSPAVTRHWNLTRTHAPASCKNCIKAAKAFAKKHMPYHVIKVTRRLASARAHISLQYGWLNVTTPTLGKLFVFDTIESARKSFGEHMYLGGYAAWAAATSSFTKPTPLIPSHTPLWKQFWKTGSVLDDCFDVWETPLGTLWCDDLMLIEHIE